jgi:PKD repeat protein
VLQATRLSGPAPLAVLFDASSTTVSSGNAFHQLGYQFDFGDDRGQTWGVSGQSKNVQSGGPIAAHVFDVPGTYTVRVRASSTSGSSEATVTITVQSQDSAYSGANTVCVSTSASYSGCPSGAATQTSLPSSYAGKRVLLRRGESFGAVNIRHADDNVVVGAFGTGAKPRVQRVGISENAIPVAGQFADDVTVMDLDIASGISHQNSGARHLYYRNDLIQAGGSNGIYVGGALGYSVSTSGWSASSFYIPREFFIVENRIVGATSGTPDYNFYGGGSRLAILGNDMGRAIQHTLRLTGAHKSIVAHNALRGQSSDGIRSSLKLHGNGLLAYADNFATTMGRWAASQVVIANNLFGDPSDNNSWTSAAAPQNTAEPEGLEDVIAENNRYYRGSRTNTEMVLVGRRMTTRGNARMDGGALNINNIPTMTFNLPADWQGPYWIGN